jgi:hypothetical protein
MNIRFFKRYFAAAIAAIFIISNLIHAQTEESNLKITRPQTVRKENTRKTPIAEMEQSEAFQRINPEGAARTQTKSHRRITAGKHIASRLGQRRDIAKAEVTTQSFGTGDGDIFEIEPNNVVAQNVGLPVNIFGEIRFNGDVDFFAVQALAGQQINVEAFAARLRNSQLVADIALFDSNGGLIDSSFGDEDTDPLIQFVSPSNQVLIVGIADIDDFGGSRFDYVLNITRGVDEEEEEPNGITAQSLPEVPTTVFGEIDGRNDVDFYSFIATAGQTLIVDVDAEVLGSRLDSEINLIDPESGTEFIYDDQNDGDDSRYNIVLPYTGRYVIGIGSFNANSTGFYRLNISLVPSNGAPTLLVVRTISKKLIEVDGTGFTTASRVEVNGRARKTTLISSGTLRAKIKAKAGDVITVANLPDERRSNPLIVQ